LTTILAPATSSVFLSVLAGTFPCAGTAMPRENASTPRCCPQAAQATTTICAVSGETTAVASSMCTIPSLSNGRSLHASRALACIAGCARKQQHACPSVGCNRRVAEISGHAASFRWMSAKTLEMKLFRTMLSPELFKNAGRRIRCAATRFANLARNPAYAIRCTLLKRIPARPLL
jgi:hypothetical protein